MTGDRYLVRGAISMLALAAFTHCFLVIYIFDSSNVFLISTVDGISDKKQTINYSRRNGQIFLLSILNILI